jgi:hypothetical protein
LIVNFFFKAIFLLFLREKLLRLVATAQNFTGAQKIRRKIRMSTEAEQRRFRHLRAALTQHLDDAAEVAYELPVAEHDLFLRHALFAWWDRTANEPIDDGQFTRMVDAMFADEDDEEVLNPPDSTHESGVSLTQPISATGSGEPET